MILGYNYWYFQSALPDEICDRIVEAGLEKMHEARKEFGEFAVEATTGDLRARSDIKGGIVEDAADITLEDALAQGKDMDTLAVRNSEVSWLNEDWMYKLIWPYVHEANYGAGWNFDWDFTEDFQFTKYGLNQYYGWHADTGSEPYEEFNPDIHEVKRDDDGNPMLNPQGETMPLKGNLTGNEKMLGKIRKLSVTVSLSDPNDYEGGNLKFDLGPHREDRYHECTEIRPRGSIIIFPSHVYHQVTPVTSGTRYSLVAWNLGRPWR